MRCGNAIGPHGDVRAVACGERGELVAGDAGGRVVLWRSRAPHAVRPLGGLPSAVLGVAISPRAVAAIEGGT
jgi:hypothetical protein